jgi:hypothetical protein
VVTGQDCLTYIRSSFEIWSPDEPTDPAGTYNLVKGKDLRFKPVRGEQSLKLLDEGAFAARQVRDNKPDQVLKDF